MSTKEEVMKLIKGLPDNVTLEEIMKELYVRSKIEKGLDELQKGNFVSHNEVKEKLGNWLK
ncbi:hypothetical protein [Halalkalibacter alkaliphilus]|uniref:Uncharacterized protein n=1 Tax=Halalkalibacter alkaliphilus TaxID=2917993 RepID=A0A9X2CUL4_9BACI|nr:hypothetical protein [Halalkalibacter alkaliphilus]MCL7748558.1 hypothetical protein [Halalkalibacter alkaliphilus]